MRHHNENHTIILGAILLTVIIVIAACCTYVAYRAAVGDMGEALGAVHIVDSDECHRELLIEGCDKHGDNCAPIYLCTNPE